jgi:DNA-nicking Smr family endonuclease
MKAPRGLSADEAALWARVARTVTPLHGQAHPAAEEKPAQGAEEAEAPRPPRPPGHPAVARPAPPREDRGQTRALSPDRGLDSTWERKLARAAIEPDFTLDLHGHTLDQAHHRLDMGLGQAKAMGARLVLLITGKPRPAEAADRGTRRGAIRAKVLDWLAAGPHGSDIAAIRKAHRRHGGEGALYLILKRQP